MSVVKERPVNFEELRLESLATVFKALSDVTRLRILQHLTQHESCCKPGEGICACDLEGVTGLSQPNHQPSYENPDFCWLGCEREKRKVECKLPH